MYIQGFVVPVLPGKKEAYAKMAREAGEMFHRYGAIEIVEAFETDIPTGKHTDFRKAVKAEEGEHIVFSWVIWPDKETCDKAARQMEENEDMEPPSEMAFAGKRLIYGGFTPIYTLGRELRREPMADYTFFTNPMSRGQIARWALHEVGANYDTQLVDWTNKPKALTDANPIGKVPTLVHHHHGDHIHVVTEAAAICHYLAEMHPERGLLPKADEKADYFRYLFFAAGPIEQAVTAKAMGWDVPEDKQVMPGFGTYDRAMDTFETLLSDRDYVCGERFTMADVYVGSQVAWGLQFGSIPERDVFKRYAERVRGRPACAEATAIDEKLIAEMQASS